MQKIELKAKELGDHIHDLVHHFLIEQHNSNPENCPSNMNKQEMRVIETLGKKGPCIMSELAEYIMLAVSTLTGIIDTMVEKKFVVRERSDADRRIVRVNLTQSGMDIHKAHEENHMKMSFGILNSLDGDEQDVLLALFRKITQKIKHEEKITV
jgi:DNA-binding MarR family transcriptional regulator